GRLAASRYTTGPCTASICRQRPASHVGYEIEATERRKGYGTQILRLAISETAKIGLDEVMVGCDAANIASQKIIEANGSVFVSAHNRLDTFEPGLTYRIKTAP